MAKKKKAAKPVNGKPKRYIHNEWKPEHLKSLKALYNHDKCYSIAEISYQLNKKFGTARATQAVSQRLVQLRSEGKFKKRDRSQGYTSAAGAVFMAALDAPAKERDRERKAQDAQPRRSSKDRKDARPNGKLSNDPLLASDSRVLECDLGARGKVRVEISGPLLLNEAFVGNLSAAVGSALTV